MSIFNRLAGISLIIFLSSVSCFSAPDSDISPSEEDFCVKALTSKNEKEIVNLYHSNELVLQHTEFKEGKSKRVLFEKGGWGNMSLIMRIENQEEGVEFIQLLVREFNRKFDQHYSLNMSGQRPEVDGLFEIYISRPILAFALPPSQGPRQLQLAFELSQSRQVFTLLRDVFHLQHQGPIIPNLAEYDLSASEGRKAFGVASFYQWYTDLNSEAKQGIDLISGSHYKEIFSFLRTGDRPYSFSEAALNKIIENLDSAIAKGKLPHSLILYRAVQDPLIDSMWERLNSSKEIKKEESIQPDPAYEFASFDEEFVENWLRTTLHGKGTILEIHASKGATAGYVVSDEQRGDYAEIILPRYAKLKATNAFVTPDGQRRMTVIYGQP